MNNMPSAHGKLSYDDIDKIIGPVYDKLVESNRVKDTSYFEIANYLCVVCGNQFF